MTDRPSCAVQQTAVPLPGRLILAVALLEPLLLSGPVPGAHAPLQVTWPRVHSGDETHYLVLLNSLVRDGDLDVSNNYESVHAGGADAGRSYRGYPLDPHISWYEDGGIVYWWEVFEIDPRKWRRDERGRPLPTPLRPAQPHDVPDRQFSWHFPGMPLLLSLVLFPVRQPEWLESLALVCTALTVILGLSFFGMLIRPYVPDGGRRGLVLAVVFLGSPVWPYARTLFTEPYQLTLALGAYALALRRSQYTAAGLLIALGVLMKPNFVLLALPLALQAWTKGELRRGLWGLGVPVLLAGAGLMGLNDFMHGAPWRTPLKWRSGNPLEGMLGLLVAPTRGILLFAPAALVALAAWPRFLRERPHEGQVLLLAFGLFFLCVSSYYTWAGGHCYGPRYAVPVLPFLLVPLCRAHEVPLFQGRIGRGAMIALCALSVLINLVGAFACEWSWGEHPVSIVTDWIV